MATVSTCYISASCNRTPHSAHWGRNGIVAFGSCRSVALYRPKVQNGSGAILSMLNGHKDKVNCVKWIQCPVLENGDETELVSGSTDNTVIVWRGKEVEYKPVAALTGHSSAVTALDAIYLPNDEDKLSEIPACLLATTSVDSTVKIWRRKDGEDQFELLQSISQGNGFALDVAWFLLPGTTVPILALGGDECKVKLYVQDGDKFVKVHSLYGHEDWVRGLEFAVGADGDLLLATCSQDCFIRIWRISPRQAKTENVTGPSVDTSVDDEIKLKENTFTVKEKGKEFCYAASLESVLAGHDHWIYGVHWQPPVFQDGRRSQEMCLLSASMDKTMILWKLDKDSGVWLDQVRVGEVGGNTLGLYGCQISPDGLSILGHGYQGAFHLWQCAKTDDAKDSGHWSPAVTVGGHFESVQDITWDPEGGEYLMSVSADQTTRLHAPWIRPGHQTTWHEISRPQVHGYDMQCLAMLGRYRLVSGADEKVLRVFDAPKNFVENFGQLCGIDAKEDLKKQDWKDLPEGASVPALGLSNKAIFQGDLSTQSEKEVHPNEQYPELYFQPLHMTEPPTEEHLLQNTLWPETQKLYGHGYEIYCVATHPAGSLIASACKAAKVEYAAIILWDTKTWQQVTSLISHSLTVTQLAFSHNGKYLLAVSRDRTWSLFKEREAGQPGADPLYSITAYTDKKTSLHSRIIWSCAWSHDDKFFATASRDKKVIVWGQRLDDGANPASSCLGNYTALSTPLNVEDSATAVDFASVKTNTESYMLAIGTESGAIFIYGWALNKPSQWERYLLFDAAISHNLTVKRLRWRHHSGGQSSSSDQPTVLLKLASCSADHSVRIFDVDISKVVSP
ncbi:elongator complex protein 2-like [Ptychodera flava]|uniref:elongator complex protein 2-like n=1 Tax=Ptychodera flava TaxID=63121 RepID=UPI00396A0678